MTGGIEEFFSAPLASLLLMAHRRERLERLYGPVEVALPMAAPKAQSILRDTPTVLIIWPIHRKMSCCVRPASLIAAQGQPQQDA